MDAPRSSIALVLSVLGVALLAGLLLESHPAKAVIVTNGVITMGFGPNGELIDNSAQPASCQGTVKVGIRYIPTGCEGISAGCACEGWGASYNNDVTTDGWAGGSTIVATGTPVPGVDPVDSFFGCAGLSTTSGVSATTVNFHVDICDLSVMHRVHPSVTPGLFEVDVTLQNNGTSPIDNVLYRRVMDWDVEPNHFNEYVTLDGVMPWPIVLMNSNDNGFGNPDPLVNVGPGCGNAVGPPVNVITDNGPCDHGSLFNFNFGTLGPGIKRTFQIYYGAQGNEVDSLQALTDVNAQIWSLGQYSGDPTGGTPQTFIFGFAGLPTPDPLAIMNIDPWTKCAPVDLSLHDLSLAAVGSVSTWDFGDSSPTAAGPTRFDVTHTYVTSGAYRVTLTVDSPDGKQSATFKDIAICGYTPPFPAFSIDPYDSCVPITLTFHDTTTWDRRLTATSRWDFGDGGRAGPVRTGTTVKHTYTTGGAFTVTLTVVDSNGAMASTSGTTVVVCTAPLVDFTFKLDKACPDYITTFYDSSIDPDGTVVYWAWLFGDGQGSTERSPTHIYAKGGTYTVTLTATDNDGYSDDLSQTLNAHGQEACPINASDPHAAKPQAGDPRDGQNADQSRLDLDNDGIYARDDNCRDAYNPDQKDLDLDGLGDACDTEKDGDGLLDSADNCPLVPNPTQSDVDHDGIGDACQGDADGDLILNAKDNCPLVPNPDQKNLDQDSRGDVCDLDIDGDGHDNVNDAYPLDAAAWQVGDAGQNRAAPVRVAAATEVIAGVPQSWALAIFATVAAVLVLGIVAIVVSRRK